MYPAFIQLGFFVGADRYQFVGSGPVDLVDPSGLAVYYGVKNPNGVPFGSTSISAGGGGHAFVVVTDGLEPSGYAVYSFEGNGWNKYDWEKYRKLPDNKKVPLDLYRLPGAHAALAVAEIKSQMTKGNNNYAVGGKVCSVASDKVAAAATVGLPLHGDIQDFRFSPETGDGEAPEFPDALPKYLEKNTSNGIPVHHYPAQAAPAPGVNQNLVGQSGIIGGFLQWLTSHL